MGIDLEDETEEGLTNTLRGVLSKAKEELHQKGMTARDYVLYNKNDIVQAKKIVELIEMMNSK